MKAKELFKLLSLLILTPFSINAQTSLQDRLFEAWKNDTLSESERCKAFTGYTSELLYNYPDSMESLNYQELEIAERKNLFVCQCQIYNNLGMIAKHRGNLNDARKFFEKTYELAKSKKLGTQKYAYFNNIGILDISELNYESAIQNFRRALKVASDFEEVKTHNTLHNIALCYSNIGNYEKALDYYKLSLAERKKLKDTRSMLYSYINIGVLYMNQEQTDSAVQYFELSKSAAEQINDHRVLGFAEINLSNIL